MIHGLTVAQSKLDRLLLSMHESGIDFHLTGSRFFLDKPPENADYDFITRNLPKTEDWLEDNGFAKHTDSNYRDSDCACVYRHKECPVDVQLVIQPEVKLKVQGILKKSPAFKHLTVLMPKAHMRLLWDIAYACVTMR